MRKRELTCFAKERLLKNEDSTNGGTASITGRLANQMKRIYGIRHGSHGEKRVELSNSAVMIRLPEAPMELLDCRRKI